MNESEMEPVVLVRRDYDTDGLYVNPLLVCRGISIKSAFKAAVKEFMETDEGKEYARGIYCSFNYADALSAIPDEILEKHGIVLVETPGNIVEVDENTNLLPERSRSSRRREK